jgi:predicted methyltransferase
MHRETSPLNRSEEEMKKKSYQTVIEKKILKILTIHTRLSKNKIMSLAKMPRRRCAESLDDLLKDQYLILQNERYEITEMGIHYLDEMMKRDKRGRQSRSQLTGRDH